MSAQKAVILLSMMMIMSACNSGNASPVPALSTSAGGTTTTYLSSPENMTQAVEFGDLIIEGEITAENFLGQTGGYANGALVLGTPDPFSQGSGIRWPLMEYTIRVDTIHKGSEGVDVGDLIYLRMEGAPGTGDGCSGDPRLFDEYPLKLEPVGSTGLFVLTETSDLQAYGFMFGESSRLDISGSKVMTTSCSPRVVPFTSNTTPTAFLAELAAAIAAE